MAHTTYRDKDDLGRPRPPPLSTESSWTSSLRFRRKRRALFILISVCAIIYLFVHSKFWNDVLVVEETLSPGSSSPQGSEASSSQDGPTSRNAVPVDPSLTSKSPDVTKFVYEGKIKFMGFYETLAKVQQFNYRLRDKHVVFVASNMNTASILAGVACEMSTTKKNVVHLALVGRNEISIEFFKKSNGMNSDTCGVIIHDARPDMASISTDERMGRSLKSAISYLKEYISPSVLISALDREDAWFQAAIVKKAKDMKITHVSLPSEATSIPWFQKLDALSLASWHKPSIDIVIHADVHSGQLVRLLKSLKNADYFSAALPRLFIDLDPGTDKSVRQFLDGFSWPSKDRLFVRHRVLPKSSIDKDPTSFVESYYPSGPDSAVLFLSPNIELSPFYYHFLFYAILEYKYSNAQSGLDKNLIYGISLDMPLAHLDGEVFDASELQASSTAEAEPAETALPPFLYAGPSTHATLFFGTHWRLLHLYLAKRLDATYTQNVDYKIPGVSIKEGVVPNWVGYFCELLTAGGYMMLYPNFDPSESLAVYHKEKKSKIPTASGEKGIMKTNNLLSQLPGGQLGMWTELPVVDMSGRPAAIEDILKAAVSYKKGILKNCGGLKRDDGEDDSVDDLFCNDGDARREKDKKQRLKDALEIKQRQQEELDREKAEESAKAKLAQNEEGNIDEVVTTRKKKSTGPSARRGGNAAIIPHKIVSLDELDKVPVEVDGEEVLTTPEEDVKPKPKKIAPPVPIEE